MDFLESKILDEKILKDSSSYRLLLEMFRAEHGERIRVEEARFILNSMATERFGDATEAQKAFLDGIADYDRLLRLCHQVWNVSTWDELLASA
jgi:hypothetical protein